MDSSSDQRRRLWCSPPAFASWKVGLLAGSVALLSGARAEAGAGDHIQVGDYVEIAPSISTGVEFRTNSFLSVGAVQSERPRDQARPSFNYLLRPRLGIEVNHPKVKFNFDGVYELRKWFDKDLAESLDRFNDFTITSGIDVLPKGVVGFAVRDTAVLRNRESDNPYRGNALLTQLRNDVGADLKFRIGPEFEVAAGFGWAFHNYRVPGAQEDRNLNTRNTYAPSLTVNWRFFPNTAFVVETVYQRNVWKTNWIPTEQTVAPEDLDGLGAVRSYGEFLAMPDSHHFKAMAGMRGRVTRNVVAILMAGWGLGRYDLGSVDEESAGNPGLGNEADPAAAGFDQNVKGVDGLLVVARMEIDAGFNDERTFGQKVDILFRKDFQDSFFTNYVHQNHLRLGLQSRWGRYLTSNVGFGPRFEEYVGEVERRDIFLRADFGLRIAPTRWMGFDVGGAWSQRASSQTDVQYDNIQAFVLANFSY